MPAGGYFGRALVVDVGDRAAVSAPLPLDDAVLRAYLGGVGLGTWLLHRLAPPGVDPLAPDAPLAFVFSPLVGTPLTTSAKFAVVAKSPLTGLLTDALASSRFAIAGKLTGNDAIVVRGRAADLSVLLVDGGTAPVSNPRRSWPGCRRRRPRRRCGSGSGVAGRPRPSGRPGSGRSATPRSATTAATPAAAGWARSWGPRTSRPSWSGRPPRSDVHDQAAVLAAAKDLRARSFGPATAKYRELGTLANLLAFNAVSTLPTRNFTAATFDGAPRLAAEELHELRGVARNSCASCSIGCEHIYSRKGGGSQRMEYENVFALGPLCGVSDPDDVFAASARCDELGLDTISAGGTIAWAMECAERGLIDAPWLRFGDGAALLRALDLIGARTGLGELLAQGSRRAAEIVGEGSIDFAPQVKGLELPGYEPRTLQAMALGLAVNSRGADHNRSGAYEADLSGEHDRLDGGPAHVAAAVGTEDRAAVMDSMILCKFLRGVFDDPFTEWAALLRAVTGWDVDAAELRATARRIVLAKRVFNLREGATAADDTLPRRMLETPLELGSGRTAALTEDRLRAMVGGYYAARGWDAEGRPEAGKTSPGCDSASAVQVDHLA